MKMSPGKDHEMTEIDAKMMLSRVRLGTSRCQLVRGKPLSEQQRDCLLEAGVCVVV